MARAIAPLSLHHCMATWSKARKEGGEGMTELKKIPCGECGMLNYPNSYHPRGFCVLWKAGIEPWGFVKEAWRRQGYIDVDEYYREDEEVKE